MSPDICLLEKTLGGVASDSSLKPSLEWLEHSGMYQEQMLAPTVCHRQRWER
jgi:hypothetical protein